MKRILLVLLLLPLTATAREFTSGPNAVTVLELFTSQGCSSCPPADRWFSSLRDDPALFRTFFPMAFHVDYWNGLGWEDPFSRAGWSERQRRYHHEGGLSSVYTPGMLANGREWRGWRANQWPDAKGRPGVLSVEVDGQRLEARFSGDARVRLHLAWLGMGLTTAVTAGENRGRTLRHDFVVLAARDLGPGPHWRGRVEVPTRGQPSTALVVWATGPGSLAPLQAAGGYLRGSSSPR